MGRDSTVNPVAKDDNSAKVSMMEMWKESVERTRRNMQTATKMEKTDEEKRAELEQKIRNGQVECPTCAARTYKDQSNDGGVSFQAARHIPASTAGITVMRHESEHVSAAEAEQEASGGEVIEESTVTLKYETCPQCGRRYVSGGVTKTTTRPASYNDRNRLGVLDTRG